MIKTLPAALLLLTVTATPAVLAQNSDAQHLSNNKCLMALSDSEQIIVTAAFHEGANGFGQLQQLLDRKPWGSDVRSSVKQEIEKLINEASPFLIVTLTKKQALMLEDHRDLIKWILVQSTSKPCS
jgi:hypothetical protein